MQTLPYLYPSAAYPLSLTTLRAIRVASPSLGGGQVAGLHPHVALADYVTSTAYSCERGERITQMNYLLTFLQISQDMSLPRSDGPGLPGSHKTCRRYYQFLMYDRERNPPVQYIRMSFSMGPGLCKILHANF